MQKKFKTILAASVCLLSTTALAGCGGDGKIHVKFWHTMGENNEKLVQRIINEFQNENPNIVIEGTSQGDYGAIHEKLMSAIPAGTMPHMAFCYPDHVADYMSSNAIVKIDDYLNDPRLAFNENDGLLEDFVESFFKQGQTYEINGTYSVPFAQSTEVMFYNVDFFRDNNLEVPTTWDEMWDLCRTIKEKFMPDGSAIKYPMCYDSDSNLFITLCEQRGIPYTSNENITKPEDHVKFNNQQAKAMISELVDYYNAGYFATKGVLPNSTYSSTYFTEGKTVMSIGSTGGTSYQTSVNFEVGVAPVPFTSNVGNGDKYILQGPSVCFFKKGSVQEKEAAWNFYKYVTRALNTAAFGIQTGYEPVRTSAYQTDIYKEYLKGPSLQAKVSKCTATISGRFYSSPVYYGSATARDQVGGIFANVAMNTKTLDAAFAEAYTNSVNATRKG